MITTHTAARLLLRYDVEYAENGLTYYTVRAPRVFGTITVHPEAPPGERDDPDAYTSLRLVSGRYDPTENPSGYTDRLAVYNSWIYDGITLLPPGTTSDRDPWERLHRSPYEVATEAARARARDVGEKIITEYRADLHRHAQHTNYLRAAADEQLRRAAREADELRPAVRRLAALETRITRWSRLRAPEASPTIVEVGGFLADWLSGQFAGHQPLTPGAQEFYRAWTAAHRLGDRAAVFQPRRIILHTPAALAAFIAYLTEAARQAPSPAARADARSRLRRIAAVHPALTVDIPDREEETSPAA
ncbi:hypothetical protein [Streptomyces rubellomurinus]|uniref:Uncharacterized protein n=1 Tax=Streptomyces rubellomurinus (strain ATCC 31215) TaxID=359131 RepID=A0A0F2T655_STRR3|nr:hypothetical protein [Streptomyces rubellomurinus]KJS57820.1 hypothetical protein VM95_37305 [Streptomyces rubellomurinus]